MKLVLLGTTGYHPNEKRHTPCFMLPEVGVVLDAGTGMFRVGPLLTTATLDIFLTHAHLDHVVGLTFFFDFLRHRHVDRVRVFGQSEKLTAIQEHLFSEFIFPVKPPMDFCPLPESVPLADGGRLTHFSLDHPGGTVGYRLDWPDRSMAYVTDTTAAIDAAYVERIRGVDLLVHECYFPDSLRDTAVLTGHSHTTPVAEVARRADVGRLVLVHLNPSDEGEDPIGLPTARAIFEKTEIAHDGMEVLF